MKVKDIMSVELAAVLPADTIVTAARTMRAGDIGLLPVVADRTTMQLIGVITDRDIATRCVADGHSGDCLVSEHMSPPPLETAHVDDEVASVSRKMRLAKVRRIPIVDRGDRLVGIVAQADLATHSQSLELRLLEDTLASISQPLVHA